MKSQKRKVCIFSIYRKTQPICYLSIYIRKIQTIPWGENKKERDVYFSIYIGIIRSQVIYIVKLLYYYIYTENTNYFWGKKKKKKEMYIYKYLKRYIILSIYIGKTQRICIAIYRKKPSEGK